MNFAALEGFVKTVELNSFSAAADALYLSQSALSQQIRTLEGQLEFELFQHVPRKVLLTPAGLDFYPKAKQLLASYQEAVRHARAVERKAEAPARHLTIAYSQDSMRMFGYDLFSLIEELCINYTPILSRCTTRDEIWRKLKSGELDLSFQLESAEFYVQGLTFQPMFYMPEVCIPIHLSWQIPDGKLTLGQAAQFRWLLTKYMSQTIYENALIQEGIQLGTNVVPSGSMRSIPYGVPSLMLVPLLYYRRPDLSFVRLLDWNRGHRFGIVVGKKADDPVVMGYVRALKQALPPLTKQLFGVELEQIEE